MDAVDLKLAPTIAKRLSSTVEWLGTTVATFTANYWLTLYYVCILSTSHSTPLPTHPHAMLVPKLVPTSKNLKSRENQPTWIFKVRCVKANNLVRTLMGTDKAWYKQQLVIMDRMFKNGIS